MYVATCTYEHKTILFTKPTLVCFMTDDLMV